MTRTDILTASLSAAAKPKAINYQTMELEASHAAGLTALCWMSGGHWPCSSVLIKSISEAWTKDCVQYWGDLWVIALDFIANLLQHLICKDEFIFFMYLFVLFCCSFGSQRLVGNGLNWNVQTTLRGHQHTTGYTLTEIHSQLHPVRLS